MSNMCCIHAFKYKLNYHNFSLKYFTLNMLEKKLAQIRGAVDSSNRVLVQKLLGDNNQDAYLILGDKNANDNDVKNLILSAIFLNTPTLQADSLLCMLGASFKFNKPLFYNLVKWKNKSQLEACIDHAKRSLDQDVGQEALGDYYNPQKKETTLIRAIKCQDEDLVLICIEKLGATVSLCDSFDRQPLHVSSGMDNSRITEILIDRGAFLEARCKNNDTPLINGCQNRKLANVELLLSRGADVNGPGFMGNRPLHVAITDNVYHDDDELPSTRLLDLILSHADCDLFAENDQHMTGFARSCASGNLDMVRILRQNLFKEAKEAYMQDQYVKGFHRSLDYLRANVVEYLIDLIDNKSKLNDVLCQSFYLNSTSYKGLEIGYKLDTYTRLFSLFIKYDLNGHQQSDRLYFVRMIYQLASSRVIQHQNHIDKAIEPMVRLIQLLQEYGWIQINQSVISTVIDLFHQEDPEWVKETLRTSLESLQITRVLDLKHFCRNAARFNLKSLSATTINSLNIPKSLKILLSPK